MGYLGMFTVDEVASNLRVSKVTIYKKLKKYETKVVLKQGKKYITEDLFNLIKKDLNVKNEVKNEVKREENINYLNQEISMDTDISFKLNKELNLKLNLDLVDILKEQLKEKDIQLKEKDKQIQELINLNKNNQVLLKQQQDKEINQFKLEDHFKEVDEKLLDLKNKMELKRKKEKSIFNFFKKVSPGDTNKK